MKALIVIDMQEEYFGQRRNQKKYPYDSEQLIQNINKPVNCIYSFNNGRYIDTCPPPVTELFAMFNNPPCCLTIDSVIYKPIP